VKRRRGHKRVRGRRTASKGVEKGGIQTRGGINEILCEERSKSEATVLSTQRKDKNILTSGKRPQLFIKGTVSAREGRVAQLRVLTRGSLSSEGGGVKGVTGGLVVDFCRGSHMLK